jgi:hypothetical protein
LQSARDYGIITDVQPERRKTMKNDIMKHTQEFKALREEARRVAAAYADGMDFDHAVGLLAGIGERMAILLS